MTKEVLSALGAAARGLLRHWPALAALAALFAALVAACGLFVTTREATLWQLVLTAATALVAPLLLFVLLAGSAAYAVGETRALPLVVRSLKGFWKVLLLALPLVALAVLTAWGMDKLALKVRHDPNAPGNSNMVTPEVVTEGDEESSAQRKPKVRWPYVFVSALRMLLLGVLIPLLAAHLWLAAARDGLGASLRRFGRGLARAYAPRSVLAYAVGMVVFALLPYFLIVRRIPAGEGWLEVVVFSARVALAFSLMLFGWLMTMTALARLGGYADAADSHAEETPQQPAPPPRRAEEPVGAGA
jgi:hypothetical protein